MRMVFSLLLLLFAIPTQGQAIIIQGSAIDSLKRTLTHSKDDTNKVKLYVEIGRFYNYKYPDTVLHYSTAGLALAKQLYFKKGEIYFLTNGQRTGLGLSLSYDIKAHG
jgi:hypothetical protein